MNLIVQHRLGRGRRATALCLAAAVTVGGFGCSGSEETGIEPAIVEQQVQVQPNDSANQADFPNVVAAKATNDADGSWTFAVTISSPYDSTERYADAWRVSGPEGEVFGVRELTHDHKSEQPFTRSKSGIEIPVEVTEVTVEGRDQRNGWGGQTITVLLR